MKPGSGEPAIPTTKNPSVRRDRFLELIAKFFKFCKAALFVLVGLGMFQLLRPEVVDWADQWLTTTAAVYNVTLLQRVEAWVAGLSSGRLTVLGVGALLYAALFATEGVGLWLEKRWAEYLTLIATASLIPFEIYEITRKTSAPRYGALLVNLVVLAYLIFRLRRGPPLARSTDS